MLELMFLFAFTLHNIEEGLWLPKWSTHAGKYHKPVNQREFHFALIVITTFVYLLAFLSLSFGPSVPIFKAIYAGFVLMMCVNAILPHALATIVLRRYSPGTLTGLLLNLPIGILLLFNYIKDGLSIGRLFTAFAAVSLITLLSLRPLFKLGNKLIGDY